jgi:hypothetical protein
MRLLPLLLLLAASATANAQTATLGASDFALALSRIEPTSGAFDPLDTDERAAFFSVSRCACPTNAGVTLALTADGAEKLTATDSVDASLMIGTDCDDVSATSTCVAVGSGLTLSTGKTSASATFPTADVFEAVAPGTSCAALRSTSSRLWAIVRVNGTRLATEPSLTIGLGAPGPRAPTAVRATTGDGGLSVTWSAPSDTTTVQGYQVLCSPGPATPPAPAFDACASGAAGAGTGPFASLEDRFICSARIAAGASSTRVGGLENGVAYQVAVIAIGADGTPSAASEAVEGTPAPTAGFEDLYRESGGTGLDGGCAWTGAPDGSGQWAAASAILLIAVAAARTRRRARARSLRPPATALLLAMLTGGDVMATETRRAMATETPRRWNLELRLGPYYPGVDQELADRGQPDRPFAQTFGTDPRWMWGLELDRHLSHVAGTWAVGFGLGYYRASASALAADRVTRTGDTTWLRVLPASMLGVYRADVVRERWASPLVPYAKVGLVAAFWATSDSARPSAIRGKTFGWTAAAGVSFDLASIDPEAARTMALETGIDQLALFGEVTHKALDGFGSGSVLRLGDTTWFVGLMLEI